MPWPPPSIAASRPPEALDRADQDDLAPPSHRGIEIPRHAETALPAALAVKAADRTQDLATLQAQQNAEAAPPPPPPPGPDPSVPAVPSSKGRGPALAVGLALLALVGAGLGLWQYSERQAERQRQAEQARAENERQTLAAERQRIEPEKAELDRARERQAAEARAAAEAQAREAARLKSEQERAEAAHLKAEQEAAARRAAEAKTPAAAARQAFEPEMVRIPAGSFLMGSPEDEPERGSDEGPRHRVQVPAFELGKTEVAFDQWDACGADAGCSHKPEDEGWGRGKRPVVNVSWYDAQHYVKWLSKKTGKGYRLPSEAEWEYAARAGTATPFSTGNCIKTTQANYNGNNYDYNGCGAKTGVYLKQTQPVGSCPANPWALHDVQGNVREWTEDCRNDSYGGAPKDGTAWRDGDCRMRVLRGGGWDDYPWNLRSTNRDRVDTGNRHLNLGFRVARTLSP